MPSSTIPARPARCAQRRAWGRTLVLLLAAALAPSACCPAKAGRATPALAPQAVSQPMAEAAPAPAPAAELAFPEDAYRLTQPPAAPVHQFTQPAPQRFKLANGIEVYLVERHTLPTVTMELNWDYGAASDPPGKEGLASLCAGLISDGTQQLDKLAFEEALADLGAEVSSYAGRDQQGIELATLSKNLEPALDLFADAVLRPGLRHEEFERAVKQRLAELEQTKGSAAPIAQRMRPAIVFGLRHPYGRFFTEASTRALRVEDCRRYAAATLKPGGARLYVVGDVTRREIEEKVGTRLAAMKGRAPTLPVIGKPQPPRGRVFLVNVPDSPQTMLYVQGLGPARTAPDYIPTSIMSAILGGGFSSRINMNLREQHGWAYGARAQFAYQRGKQSVLVVAASVQADATGQSISEIIKELKGLRDADATAAEMTRERDGAVLGLPARFATGEAILESYRELVYFGLPLDWYAKYVPAVLAVTPADVRKAATSHLKPDELTVLVAGDARILRPQLTELVASGQLGKGEIVELDADGNVVPAAAPATAPATAPAAVPSAASGNAPGR